MKTILLTRGMFAIVDDDTYPALMKFKWRAVKAKCNFYAKSFIYNKGRQWDLSMHRLIAKTPFGMITHHINGNSLDNRRVNLDNQDKLSHTLHHANNNIRRKLVKACDDPAAIISGR